MEASNVLDRSTLETRELPNTPPYQVQGRSKALRPAGRRHATFFKRHVNFHGHFFPMEMAQRSNATTQLASKECQDHMEGMHEVYQSFRSRPLCIRAHLLESKAAASVDTSANGKTVHFVRHGQGFHNLLADIAVSMGKEWTQFSHSSENPYVRPELLDPPLTEIGRQQAYQLQTTTASCPLELIVCSPMCRTMQTALMAFAPHIGTVPFLAHEMVREETGVHICDQRRSRARQHAEFPQVQFDLLESEEDPLFQHHQRETKMQVAHRIYTFLEWLAQRPEEHVAVATHSGWLLTLFNAVIHEDCDPKLKTWWNTGEMRSVRLQFLYNQEEEEDRPAPSAVDIQASRVDQATHKVLKIE